MPYGDANKCLNTKLKFIAHRREKDGESQDLWKHLEETSSLAGKFASKIGLKEHGKLIGLLHDLGKASSESDKYIRSATGLINSDEDDYVDFAKMKEKIEHASAGAQVVYNYFSDKGNVGLLTMQILALTIASHHSGLIDCLAPDGHNTFTKRMEKANEKTRYKECILNLDSDIRQEIDALLSDDSLVYLLNQKLSSLKEEA
ncbi:MAG: CRISPR-associated endonuclease Cas3'' [Desulfitobacteriaceae bacterium]